MRLQRTNLRYYFSLTKIVYHIVYNLSRYRGWGSNFCLELAKIMEISAKKRIVYSSVYNFVGQTLWVIPNYEEFSPELSTPGGFEHKIYLNLGKNLGKIIHRTTVLVLVSRCLTGWLPGEIIKLLILKEGICIRLFGPGNARVPFF